MVLFPPLVTTLEALDDNELTNW